ncbi:vanadium-dependent haloperoxidase [Chondrinema litorale]|uniref:vanadium-dependent haloperoxidase n=1 Tax=Chondrinema litorale TaxID=2994555 RepID=UPI0025444724|nr:vanadium-dependent haloperoxidase [Chondrinema litorale]UZR94590.1 phosphatase PAP2 family protein [Chondrinema litorale]
MRYQNSNINKKVIGIGFINFCVVLLIWNSCQRMHAPYDVPESRTDNQIVLDLNKLTYTIANDHDQFYSFIGVRALAMVHLAMHDIFNSIDPKFEQYYYKEQKENFDPVVAAAEATRNILLKAYPNRADTINMVCDQWIDMSVDAALKKAGIMLGREVAQAYITLRDKDGHEKRGDYTPMTKPGNYQFTPEFDWVLIPDFSVAKPFTLDSLTQFRSPAPPALKSEEYISSFNEVKAYGGKNSTVRTEDQTNYAHWWAEFAEHGWNRIGRITAAERNLSRNKANRMFALLNMNLYDLYMVSLESKYFYDTWRPYTAIRNAAKDGNAKTAEEKNWEPEMLTPPWPEYPSAHAACGAAGAEIVAYVYGTPKVSFTMESTTALPDAKYRSYNNLNKAAEDCADSRVMNGYHFRFATDEGLRQGRMLAKHTINNFLKPVEVE